LLKHIYFKRYGENSNIGYFGYTINQKYLHRLLFVCGASGITDTYNHHETLP